MTAPTDPVPAHPAGRPIVFYSPHQDDETLFMGQIIAHHVLAGRQVHVVLGCNGALSNVRANLNGSTLDTDFWDGWHYPAREGYEPLSLDDFGLARTREFLAALAQLGVPAERVHFGRADEPLATSDLLPDAISVDWAEQVVTSWAEHFAAQGFPQVGHYTMHPLDPHADHAALGQAVKNLHADDAVRYGDVRWLTKPEEAAKVTPPALPYVLPAALAPTIKLMVKHAAEAYRAWAPPQRFAIGYHSVGTIYFPGVESGVANHHVRP
jgi:LmbE family N-acetylglucosaminyl deacetylase